MQKLVKLLASKIDVLLDSNSNPSPRSHAEDQYGGRKCSTLFFAPTAPGYNSKEKGKWRLLFCDHLQRNVNKSAAFKCSRHAHGGKLSQTLGQFSLEAKSGPQKQTQRERPVVEKGKIMHGCKITK